MAAKKKTKKKSKPDEKRKKLAHCIKVLRKNRKAGLAECQKGWRGKSGINGVILGSAKVALGISKKKKKATKKKGRKKSTNGRRTRSTAGDTGASLAQLIAKHERILATLKEAQALAEG